MSPSLHVDDSAELGEIPTLAASMPAASLHANFSFPVAFPEAFDRKIQLRKDLRTRLAKVPAGASAVVAEAFESWLLTRPDLRVLAIYAALPDEVDLHEIVSRHRDRTWLYPRVNGKILTLHAVADPARDLISGSFGIREPDPSLPAFPANAVDAFVCPGLGFDPRGGRIGRGRGFYDRLLAKARSSSLKIGVCHPFQLVPDTFSEPHDIHMDFVISSPV